MASIARDDPSTLPGDDPIRIDPKHVVSYSTSTVTKARRTSLEILRGRNCAGRNSGLGTSDACRTTATIQIDAEGVISYLSYIMTKALVKPFFRYNAFYTEITNFPYTPSLFHQKSRHHPIRRSSSVTVVRCCQ